MTMVVKIILTNTHADERKQIGAVEACWTHNPEVGGSKPLSAKIKYRTAITPATNFLFDFAITTIPARVIGKYFSHIPYIKEARVIGKALPYFPYKAPIAQLVRAPCL